ncbi:MAG TPA: hypothetical protein VMD99_05910 [Terriglobales bacterium]|nr:hypothetical protein [Terriglobales bacterium]
MRLAGCICFFFFIFSFVEVAVSFAQDRNSQDTNFPAGPQYLMNYGSPLFLRPIETPTLSLLTPPAVTPDAPAEEHSGRPDTPAFGELQTQAQIDWIYWGVRPTGASKQSRQTPTAHENNENSPNENAHNKTAREEIDLTAAPATQPLPSSIFDNGATAITTPAALRARGYGISLGDYAALVRAHEGHAAHIYTNADIARLHRE